MTPLPPPLGSGELIFWRLDQARFKLAWDNGEGSYRVGGRWNSRGVRAVYAALDPATAILEVAVHKTFRTLDTVPHVLTWVSVVICTLNLLPNHGFSRCHLPLSKNPGIPFQGSASITM